LAAAQKKKRPKEQMGGNRDVYARGQFKKKRGRERGIPAIKAEGEGECGLAQRKFARPRR